LGLLIALRVTPKARCQGLDEIFSPLQPRRRALKSPVGERSRTGSSESACNELSHSLAAKRLANHYGGDDKKKQGYG